MAKKLNNDVIQLVLSLSVDQARKDYHALAKDNQDLTQKIEVVVFEH